MYLFCSNCYRLYLGSSEILSKVVVTYLTLTDIARERCMSRSLAFGIFWQLPVTSRPSLERVFSWVSLHQIIPRWCFVVINLRFIDICRTTLFALGVFIRSLSTWLFIITSMESSRKTSGKRDMTNYRIGLHRTAAEVQETLNDHISVSACNCECLRVTTL